MLIAAVGLVAALLSSSESGTLAADYYQGDGLGVNWNLELHPDGTFAFSWDGCLGNYDQQSGGWCLINELVCLDVVNTKPDPDMLATLPATLRPVHWGDRIYLIPEGELITFCNAVNDGGEPRDESWGLFFLREGDWDRPAAGMPAVPAKVQKYLLSTPVRGRVTDRIARDVAVVDRGTDDGLLPGMILYFQGSYDLVSYRVTSVASNSCHVEVLDPDIDVPTGPVSTLLWDDTLRPKDVPK